VLVLASDALFPHFFSAESQGQLDQIADWTRSSTREDSPLLREQIANADVLMTTWHSPFLTAEMLGAPPRVKLIAHCGGEVKARVAEEIFDYVTVTNAADPMARGVAEMALALVLTLVRRIPDYAAEMRDGVVRTNDEVGEGESLSGRRVGRVGFGRIGREFAKLIRPFEVETMLKPKPPSTFGISLEPT
jgi:phosphoglycerate dehydrogenase-like enzyme